MFKTIAILLMVLLPSMALSKVTYDKETQTMRITGPTDMSQVVEASNIIKGEDVSYIEMWGPGGDMIMGLQLGRLINKVEDVTVTIPKNRSCISACGFSALGADHIRIDGKLMLHRPYISHVSAFEKLEDSLAYMGRGYLYAAYYLEDLGYSRNVMESMMMYTSPCKFMVYKEMEITKPEELKMWYSDDSNCKLMGIIFR